jgi:hypothetical protein
LQGLLGERILPLKNGLAKTVSRDTDTTFCITLRIMHFDPSCQVVLADVTHKVMHK